MPPRLQHVLVVEDDPDDQFIAQRVLERSGCVDHIHVAPDGWEGLARLGVEKPPPHPIEPRVDLVLLDINMPVFNGFEVLERLSRLAPEEQPVVVMLTSSLNQADQALAQKYSCVRRYCAKPLTVEMAKDLAQEFGAPSGA